jgi:hypothetical protein
MQMGGDKGIAAQVLGFDDMFQEYMLTLSGMGLRDRLAPFKSIRRKTAIMLSTVYKNKLSPFMMGMEGGSSFSVSRMISTIIAGNNAAGQAVAGALGVTAPTTASPGLPGN